MPRLLAFAAAHGIVAKLLGYWLSHKAVLNTSASGAISVAGFALFLLSWLLAPRAGLVTQWLTRRRLRRTIALENLIKAIEELGRGAPVRVEAVVGALRMPPKSFEAAVR